MTGREQLAAILVPLTPVIIGTLIAAFLALRKWFKRLDTKEEVEQLELEKRRRALAAELDEQVKETASEAVVTAEEVEKAAKKKNPEAVVNKAAVAQKMITVRHPSVSAERAALEVTAAVALDPNLGATAIPPPKETP